MDVTDAMVEAAWNADPGLYLTRGRVRDVLEAAFTASAPVPEAAKEQKTLARLLEISQRGIADDRKLAVMVRVLNDALAAPPLAVPVPEAGTEERWGVLSIQNGIRHVAERATEDSARNVQGIVGGQVVRWVGGVVGWLPVRAAPGVPEDEERKR